MSRIDYEELLHSPLDDLDSRPPSRVAPLVSGVVVGLLTAYLVFTLLGGDGEAVSEAPPETTATTVTAAAVAPEYAAGYVEYAPDLAARPEKIVVEDDVVTVAFTSVVARGADPATTPWPHGGSWSLETAAGVALRSDLVEFGASSPGAFSVRFPAATPGPAEFDTVRLLERWDTDELTATVSLPFVGEPMRIDEPLSVPLSEEVTLLIPALELGRYQGSIDWTISGAELGATVSCVARLRDGDGAVVGTYEASPSVDALSQSGRIDIDWQRPFPDTQEGAETVDLEWVVDVATATPTAVEFSLDGVTVGR